MKSADKEWYVHGDEIAQQRLKWVGVKRGASVWRVVCVVDFVNMFVESWVMQQAM